MSTPPRVVRSTTLLDLVGIVDDLAASPDETVAVVRHLLRAARFVGSGADRVLADIDSLGATAPRGR